MMLLHPLFLAFLCLTEPPNSIAATERFISATNAGCACPDELLTFTCTVTGTRTGATVWAGSAFNCAGGEISLRHEGFFQSGGISRDCNNEVIVARSVSVVNETCFTSELNVTVSAELNSTTVMCSLDSQTQPVGMAVILLADGCLPEVQPTVSLTKVSPGELTFTWSPLASSCQTPAVQYHITSDCGNCSLTTTSISTLCSIMEISATKRNCTFSVRSALRGFVGGPSDPITVTLKVPGIPEVNNILPVYSNGNQTLIGVITIINQNSMDSGFSIYEGLPGSVVNYTIHFSLDASSTILADISNCRESICEYEISVPSTVCPSSETDDVSMIRVSAANMLGQGLPSDVIPIQCINTFVMVNFDRTTSTVSCQFLKINQSKSSAEKVCSVRYSECDQEKEVFKEGNKTIMESPNKVILQLDLSSGADCYTYQVTASDGTNAVVVDGRDDQRGNNKSISPAIIAAIVVPIIIAAVIIIIVSLLVTWTSCKYCRKKSKESDDKVPRLSSIHVHDGNIYFDELFHKPD